MIIFSAVEMLPGDFAKAILGQAATPDTVAAFRMEIGLDRPPRRVAEGMIVTEGGRFGGYGLFLSKGEFGFDRGKVVFLYNLLDLKRTMWRGLISSPASTPSCSTSRQKLLV